MLVPVSLKKCRNTGICIRNTMPVMMSTNSESMTRSVTTVPNAFGNDTPSHLFNTPQRANSPTRGTTKLNAYDKNMEFMLTLERSFSPIGSSDCRHLHPRNICANIPKGNDNSIQVQFILCITTSFICSKSNPRYIQ